MLPALDGQLLQATPQPLTSIPDAGAIEAAPETVIKSHQRVLNLTGKNVRTRKAKTTSPSFEPPNECLMQAGSVVKALSSKAYCPAGKDIPSFTSRKHQLSPSLSALQDSNKGRKILQAVKALNEIVLLTRKLHSHSLDVAQELATIEALALKVYENKDELIDLYDLNKWAKQFISSHCDIDFGKFGIKHLLNGPDAHKQSNDFYTYFIFTLKVCSKSITEHVPLHPSPMAWHDMTLCTESVSDAFLLTKLPRRMFHGWTNSLQTRRQLELAPKSALITTLPNLGGLNVFFWAKAMNDCISFNPCPLDSADVRNYLLFHLIPYETAQRLFKSAEISTSESASVATVPASLVIDPNKFLFGEEYEYVFEDGQDITLNAQTDKALRRWHEEMMVLVEKLGIHDCSVEPINSGVDVMQLYYTIGDWQFTIFRDTQLLEINVKPYALDQQFTLSGKKYSAYECFDMFIHPLAQKLNLTEASGHKHVDVRESLEGNPELLLRLLVDMEDNPCLAQVTDRVQSAQHYFPYITQRDPLLYSKFRVMVSEVNQQLHMGSRRDEAKGFSQICNFKKYLDGHFLWNFYGPCTTRHMQDKYHDPSIKIHPTSTLEFRLFHGSRSGEEARRVNELLVKRIQYLARCQNEKKPLKHSDKQVLLSGEDNASAIKQFADYIKEMGEQPCKYRCLIRIDIPESCKHLFKPESHAS